MVTGESGENWRVLSAGGMQLAPHAIPAQYAADLGIDDPPVPGEDEITKLAFQLSQI